MPVAGRRDRKRLRTHATDDLPTRRIVRFVACYRAAGRWTFVQGLALIDFDNFRRRDKKSKADLEIDARALVDQVACTFASAHPETRELDVRLYGGWTDSDGLPSRDASWLLELLPELRGRRHGLIIRPALATTMIRFPEFLLRGTVRGRNQRQKMIDGMMGCDALHVVIHGQIRVGLVTDDDDLLPAALSAHDTNAGMLTWIRCRRVGAAVNDSFLRSKGLPLHQLGDIT